MNYDEIPKEERKRLSAEVFSARPMFRVLQIGTTIVAVVAGRVIAAAAVSKEEHYWLYLALLGIVAGAISAAVWGVLISPALRREIVRRKNA